MVILMVYKNEVGGGPDMESIWKSCLKDPGKYMVISPEKLWGKQDPKTGIYQYLKHRYW